MEISRKKLVLEIDGHKIGNHYMDSEECYSLLDVIRWLFNEELSKRNLTVGSFKIFKWNYMVDEDIYKETENIMIDEYQFTDIQLKDILYISQYTKKDEVIEKIAAARVKINEIIDRVLKMDYEVEV